MNHNGDNDFSDDEIFFGKLSLKEVRKHILMDIHKKNAMDRKVCNDNEFQIIQTNSEPNMYFQRVQNNSDEEHLKSTSDPIFNRPAAKPEETYINQDLKSEDSFLEMEKALTECMSPNKTKINLDNTLDVVDFILKNAPSNSKEKSHVSNDIAQYDIKNSDTNIPKEEILSQSSHNIVQNEKLKMEENSIFKAILPEVQVKSEKVVNTPSGTDNVKNEIAVNTPISNKKAAQNLFKTPKQPISSRKETPLKTPNRSKGYEHIVSPIAAYIKNCPQVPLVKDVHPKKPLPGTSIPKLVKNAETKLSNKENVVLPPLAYRSAKKTTVINVNKEKLPQSAWVQKFTSSLRKPVVMKHDHRESAKKPLVMQQEDSFADLTLHQAEISVCTQKPAFQKAS